MALNQEVIEIVYSVGPLVGPAPAGAVFGVDSTTGNIYFNNGGVWTQWVDAGVRDELLGMWVSAGSNLGAGDRWSFNQNTNIGSGITVVPAAPGGGTGYTILPGKTYELMFQVSAGSFLGPAGPGDFFQAKFVDANTNIALPNQVFSFEPSGLSTIFTLQIQGHITFCIFAPVVPITVVLWCNPRTNLPITFAQRSSVSIREV